MTLSSVKPKALSSSETWIDLIFLQGHLLNVSLCLGQKNYKEVEEFIP